MTQTAPLDLTPLRALLGSRVTTVVSTAPADLLAHGRDEGYFGSHPPGAVVYAETEAGVMMVLAFARDHGVPVTPFAAGTSLEHLP